MSINPLDSAAKAPFILGCAELQNRERCSMHDETDAYADSVPPTSIRDSHTYVHTSAMLLFWSFRFCFSLANRSFLVLSCMETEHDNKSTTVEHGIVPCLTWSFAG